jgi:hypothetical protein
MSFADRQNRLVSDVIKTMSAKEMDLWMAWTAKEPSHSERIELAVAKLCYITAKANSKKGANIQLSDFLTKADWRDPITAEAQDMVSEFLKGFT